jgi:hypothetical protein
MNGEEVQAVINPKEAQWRPSATHHQDILLTHIADTRSRVAYLAASACPGTHQPTLVFTTIGGFGDRLRGMVTTYYAALLTHAQLRVSWTVPSPIAPYFDVDQTLLWEEDETGPTDKNAEYAPFATHLAIPGSATVAAVTTLPPQMQAPVSQALSKGFGKGRVHGEGTRGRRNAAPSISLATRLRHRGFNAMTPLLKPSDHGTIPNSSPVALIGVQIRTAGIGEGWTDTEHRHPVEAARCFADRAREVKGDEGSREMSAARSDLSVRAESRAMRGYEGTDFVFVVLGAFTPIKGYAGVFQAFDVARKACGPRLRLLASGIKGATYETLIFPPHLAWVKEDLAVQLEDPTTAVSAFLAAGDAYISNTKAGGETWGLATLEALASMRLKHAVQPPRVTGALDGAEHSKTRGRPWCEF